MQHSNIPYGACTNSIVHARPVANSPVALLAALHADLAQQHGQEQANMVGDQVQPEGVSQGRACRGKGMGEAEF